MPTPPGKRFIINNRSASVCPRQIVKAAGKVLLWNVEELTWTIESGRHIWESAPPTAESSRLNDGNKVISISPLSARNIKTEFFDNGAQAGVICKLSDFPGLPASGHLELTFVTAIEVASGDLVVKIDGSNDGLRFLSLAWPGPVVYSSASDQETVMPFMQGALIPGGWPHEIPLRHYHCNDRGLYMPWWGQRKGRSGYLAVIETDADAGCMFQHPVGGPTCVGPRWEGSLNQIAYPRLIRYSFFNRCDYVSLSKHYRSHVIRSGRFVSLRSKIAADPRIAGLVGAPVVHINTVHHIEPESGYFDREHPENNHACTTFRTRAAELSTLHAAGIRGAYVHLDGWGVHGYDSHHPDCLPPSREAGGWSGLRELTDTCHRLGYLLALHDQYRDYYHNAASYNPANAIHDAEGNIPCMNERTWYGGPQSILCTRLAPAYVRRNHEELLRHGIRVDGSYLDVFAIVPPDECHHPAHRMSRQDCMEARAQCFAIIRQLEGIASSEEPVDFAIPHLHLVHHAPYATFKWMLGSEVPPPPAPLWSLVYHDALFLPWSVGIKPGGWGIPDGDCADAHAALNGGMPYLGITPSRSEIARIKRLCRLHAEVALQEMLNHEFLNADRTLQRTTFADGTVVTANLKTGAYSWRRASMGSSRAARNAG